MCGNQDGMMSRLVIGWWYVKLSKLVLYGKLHEGDWLCNRDRSSVRLLSIDQIINNKITMAGFVK